ncbi:MAG: ABC transporter permease [Lachnospiraceae bacterium]|nr:ABC transporter permease [Lachnospiraceae bacterium]
MNRNMWRTTLREIRSSLARYLAIFAIIALGVGFFSGLKVSQEAFLDAGDRFIKENNMFDYRLVSTIGLTDEDVKEAEKLPGVEYAVPAYQAEAIIYDGLKESVSRFHSIDYKINTLSLKSGRMPEKTGEILADGRYFSSADIGKKITISDNNRPEDLDKFIIKEYEIVGTAFTPIYLNYERGTTSVGNGTVTSFFYVISDCFNMEAYTDIYVTMQEKYEIYSDEYREFIDSGKSVFESFLEERADIRYKALYSDAEKEINDNKQKLDDALQQFLQGGGLLEIGKEELEEKQQEYNNAKQMIEDAEKKLAEFKAPSTFILTRDENIGYVCFENDSGIVDGVAVVFPVFFFLVAALVCVTTMSRMIEEQRTQIGVLKALGYSSIVIMGKYIIYSGSAAITGCIGGFFLGCKVFPSIIWKVYGLLYGFSDIRYIFNVKLFLISLAVSLLCSVGTTWISCKKDLRMMAAQLMRPKSPKSGKRIFLERITGLWKKIPFLHKVSLRNIFRYRGRFIMMMLGIGGCTGLLVTGYGLSDSITEIADEQYTRIMIYDELITYSEVMDDDAIVEFKEKFNGKIESFMPIYQTSVDPVDTGAYRSLSLTVFASEEGWTDVILLHDQTGKQLDFPGIGEVILTSNVAKANSVKVGDKITFRDSDFNEFQLKITGICENYFNSYAYISRETYENELEKTTPFKSAFVCIKDGNDIHEAAAAFMDDENVSAVSVNADTREMFSKMMQTMNYIVILVISCAAALAFIVLYNLTNINITERIREIATIKVLGFYSGETAAYVFRENIALTAMGAVFGLPLGFALQRYVMSQIKIDMVTFDIHINGITYVYAILYTMAFALFVSGVMYFKLAKINMAESLKSVE